jgi:site-specific DNA-methyltransferase (adenine-specific)
VSKQYLEKHYNDENLKTIDFDAIYQDEIHWAGLTHVNNRMRKALVRENTSIILMSATGERVRNELGIDSTHVFYWNLEDEAACKRGDVDYLKNTFGEDNVVFALEKTYGTQADYSTYLVKSYAEMPRLRQMIHKLTPEFVRNFKEHVSKDEYSFDIKDLMRMNSGKLVYRDRVVKFLKSYLGTSDGSVVQSTMDTIRDLGTRIGNVGVDYYAGGGGATQLWFLPEQVSGGTLDGLSKALKSILDEHFPEYRTVIVNSSGNLAKKEGLEKFVSEQEQNAIKGKKDGLIILLGRMMAMGVSLPRADIVCMFNNLSKIELYTQESMRCLTQDAGKTEGVVVDFNPKRVLEASMTLVPRCNGTGIEIIERMTKVVAFGSNSFDTKDITEIVAHFNKIWMTQSFDKVKVLGARLNNFVGSLSVSAEEEKDIMRSSWIRNTNIVPREHQELLDTSEKLGDAQSTTSTTESKQEDTPKEESMEDVIPNFSYEILTTIPPFVAFLTYSNVREEFIYDLLEVIRNDSGLSEIFTTQCGLWWKGTKSFDFIEMLIRIFKRCDLPAQRGISSIMSALKTEMTTLIDDMHATLNLLNSILEPKDSEKKEFGEVYTPAWFVEQMLDDSYPKTIWSDMNAKFYDPAAGSGVFGVCIFYRLMDGLQQHFPDRESRKKHILTNMLFMSEIGSKNVSILRHVFGKDANIYQGDSLAFNPSQHWGLNMTEVNVIGNPPYNKERTRSGACPLYNEFIEKFIDECKTLLFVVPSRWFAGGKGLDKFRKMMLSRKDIRFITHIDDACSVFGNGVSIKGGINYFMTDRSYVGLCTYNGTPTDLSVVDILIDSRFIGLVSKVNDKPKLTSLYKGRCYGIETNDSRLTDDTSLTPCFVSQMKGSVKYIDKVHIKKPFDSWKVITTEAAHKQSSGFGNIFVGSPEHVHTGSYISFDVSTKLEAESLLSYLQCKLPNKLLGLRKASQHVNSETCKWIPLPPLDQTWTDESVNAYYNLTAEEVALLD